MTRTGSRWRSLFVAGAACIPRIAHAEDIGHDPLISGPPQAAPAPGKGPPGGNSGGESAEADLSLRGPSLSDRRPTGIDMGTAVPERRWYGWQTLLVDAVPVVGFAVAAAAPRDGRDGWIAASVTAYFVGAPIVHAAHGHGGKAVLSLGLRCIGPLMVLGGQSGNDQDPSLRVPLTILGALAIPAAIIVDSAAIAREETHPESARARVPRVGLASWIDSRRGGAGVSVTVQGL